MRLVLITYRGWVTKDATAPAIPVDDSSRRIVSSSMPITDFSILI